IRRTDFSDEFKSRIHFIFSTLQGILRLVPLMHHGTWAERVTACSTEGMPVGDGEAKMLLHGFACYDFILIIKFESQWVFRLPAFKLNFFNVRKIGFRHNGNRL